MKNRSSRNYRKARRAKLEEMMKDPEKFKEKVGTEITKKDVGIVHEIARDARLNELFKDLNIDFDELESVKKKVIRLRPKSKEYRLFSTLFRDHDGRYKVDHLINEYHDSILREGIEYGIGYGKKFIVEDIQNNRFTKEDIKNMTKDEIDEYCDEIREEI